MSYEQCIIELIKSDELRMRALYSARALNLPDWLIAAGFVRNLVWDYLFGKKPVLTILMSSIFVDRMLQRSAIYLLKNVSA